MNESSPLGHVAMSPSLISSGGPDRAVDGNSWRSGNTADCSVTSAFKM